MSNLTSDIKSFFQIKFKPRNDSLTDQYNRIFMVQVLLAATLVTGLNWYSDEIHCAVSEALHGKEFKNFVHTSCWINGFYIYEELKDVPGFKGYYGIASDLDHNGSYGKSSHTCVLNDGDPECKPMNKLFYLQYQYFPFILAALAFLYYLPYVCFYRLNSDLTSLIKEIEKEEPDYQVIVKTFFLRHKNKDTLLLKVLLNLCIKVGYLLVHVVAFICIDSVVDGNFQSFFSEWLNWSKLSNHDSFNYVGNRKFIKPGEKLLPVFGYCDVLEESADIKYKILNEHRFVCELSQNIMYHYVLLAVWLLIVVGMAVSVIGVIEAVFRQVHHSPYFNESEEMAREIYEKLPVRQQQYLDIVHKKNIERYGSLIRKLNEAIQSNTFQLNKDVAGESEM